MIQRKILTDINFFQTSFKFPSLVNLVYNSRICILYEIPSV